jgi:quinoprotein dehydrogenase-associated probable ABC transporter substrate-binding protein
MKLRARVANWFKALLGLGLATMAAVPALGADQAVVDLVNRKVLRVCSDPAHLPYSNEAGEGFENKIAGVIADELKVPVEYTWFPMSTGFVRMTLFSKRCDVIIGYAQGDELVLNSNAYYRSTYAILTKKGSPLDGVTSLSDPKLKDKKIGVIANSPPGFLMAKHGLMVKSKSYPLVVDPRFESPEADMAKDIRNGEVDAGILWGPLAGYQSRVGGDALSIRALQGDPELSTKMTYGVTLGVRPSDIDWKKQLNAVLVKRRGDIEKILIEARVPIIDDQGAPITAPRS